MSTALLVIGGWLGLSMLVSVWVTIAAASRAAKKDEKDTERNHK